MAKKLYIYEFTKYIDIILYNIYGESTNQTSKINGLELE